MKDQLKAKVNEHIKRYFRVSNPIAQKYIALQIYNILQKVANREQCEEAGCDLDNITHYCDEFYKEN